MHPTLCTQNFQHFAANTGFKRGDLRYIGVSRSPLDPLAGMLVSEDDRGPAYGSVAQQYGPDNDEVSLINSGPDVLNAGAQVADRKGWISAPADLVRATAATGLYRRNFTNPDTGRDVPATILKTALGTQVAWISHHFWPSSDLGIVGVVLPGKNEWAWRQLVA